MIIIPAIDLREGRCVRLVQGRVDQETIFSEDPVAVARGWEESGAEIIHLVDLDGAFAGHLQNLNVVKEIIKNINIPAQLGGGIRNMETIDMLLDAGLSRVILGTAAISNPELVAAACEKYGEKIVLGIDSKDGLVAIEGWEATVEKTSIQLAREMKALGLNRVVYTDVRRDGTLKGPNLEATGELAQESGLKVIASGGVACLDDIRNLKSMEEMGVEAVIMGKALYTEAINLKDAIKVAKGEMK